MKLQVVPHLHFSKGDCREAMEFYRSALGGELEFMDATAVPPDMLKEMQKMMPKATIDNKIMHAALKAKDGSIVLTAADMMDPSSFTMGDNFTAAILPSSEEETRTIYQKLSAGGKVQRELQVEFWGSLFAAFTDKFGIDWMISYDMPKKK